jgi:integrase
MPPGLPGSPVDRQAAPEGALGRSRSRRAGVPLKVVSQRIGHANPTITLTTYQHVLPGDDEQAAIIGAKAILGS